MDSVSKARLAPDTIEKMANLAVPGAALARAEELGEGYFAAAYRLVFEDGGEAILKVAPPPGVRVMRCEADIMAAEVACMALAAEHTGIPVARVLHHGAGGKLCPSAWFVMEKLPGESLNALEAQLDAGTRAALRRELGEYNAQLNGIHGERFGFYSRPAAPGVGWHAAFGEMLAGVLADAADVETALPAGARQLPARLEEETALFAEVRVPSLVHWDLWAGNIFVQGGRISGIIDFERCLWGDPLLEVGFRGYQQDPDFLAGYGAPALTPTQQARVRWYDVYLYLITLNEKGFRGYDNAGARQWAWDNLVRELAALGL